MEEKRGKILRVAANVEDKRERLQEAKERLHK